MALKITTQIGTDKGITSEAYVRIADYQISKYGYANFRIEIYQSQADAPVESTIMAPLSAGTASSQQIGSSVNVQLKKEDGTIDLSGIEQVNIFVFGYGHLRTKLEGLFGSEHVIDC